MTLPPLPKKYERKEAKIDGRVADWFYHNWPRPVALEVKIAGGTLKEHQERFLNQVSTGKGFKYKFRDGGTRTPCDYVVFPVGSAGDAVLATCEGTTCECVINNSEVMTIHV